MRKYNKEDYNYTDDIYLSICNSDNFQGLIVPKRFEEIIEVIVNFDTRYNIIDTIFDDYDEYIDYEIECAHQARHGSGGSEVLKTLDDLLKYFEPYNDELNKKLMEFKNVNF